MGFQHLFKLSFIDTFLAISETNNLKQTAFILRINHFATRHSIFQTHQRWRRFSNLLFSQLGKVVVVKKQKSSPCALGAVLPQLKKKEDFLELNPKFPGIQWHFLELLVLSYIFIKFCKRAIYIVN